MSSDIEHLESSTLANYFYGCVLKNKGEAQNDTTLQNQYLGEAKKYFYHTNAISPGYPYGYFRLGLIYRYDRYQPDSAFYFFKKAFTLNSGLPDVTYEYGRAEYEFGDMKIASDVFAQLYQRVPNDTFTVFYHALLLIKTGQWHIYVNGTKLLPVSL
jgi:tetratricopeptide (TPR) repeat protein